MSESVVTQKELAQMVGVSYITVNRVFNNKGGVGEETRRRILEIADRVGYKKNLVASSLVKRRTSVVGLVLCGTQNSFFGEVAKGVQRRARELNYHVLLADSEGKADIETDILESMLEIRVSGLIVQPAPDRKDLGIYDKLRKHGVKILTINNRYDAVSKNFIGSDDRRGAMQAVEYLIKLGHRRIAHLAGPPSGAASEQNQRLVGYERGMHRAGLMVNPDWIIQAPGWRLDWVPGAITKLMQLHPRPTAIFAATDGFAMVAIQKLLSMGLKVPEDISIIGYANMPECIYSAVPLTTMDQHPYKMGSRAIEILIDLIEEKIKEPYVELLEDTLVERASCRKIREM